MCQSLSYQTKACVVAFLLFLGGITAVSSAWAWAGPPGEYRQQQQEIVQLQHRLTFMEQVWRDYVLTSPSRPTPGK